MAWHFFCNSYEYLPDFLQKPVLRENTNALGMS